MPTRKINLVLKSHMNEINLGLREVIDATKMRVEMMRYITVGSSEKYLHFDIPEFSSDNLTIEDSTTKTCAKVFALDSGANMLVRYSNLDNNSWDVVRDTPISFKNMKINVFIDNALATTQITSGNPLILTLHFE